MQSTKLLFLLIVFVVEIHSLKIPPHFPRCKRVYEDADSQEFERCYITNSNIWLSYMKNGVSALGIPQIDPIIFPEITVNKKAEMFFDFRLYNASLSGLSDHLTTYMHYRPDLSFSTGEILPKLNLKGYFKMNGNSFGTNFNIQGPFNASLANTKVHVKTQAIIVLKNDTEYYQFSKFDVIPEFPETNIELPEQGRRGDKLDDCYGKFLNLLFGEIMTAIKPDISEFIKQLYVGVSKQVVNNVPFNEIFIMKN